MKSLQKIIGSLAGFTILLIYSLIMTINITFFSALLGLNNFLRFIGRKLELTNLSLLICH